MEKVLVKRYPGTYTLLGSPTRLIEIDEACVLLARSGFMEQWIREAIKEHLLAGGNFRHYARPKEMDNSWKGREDGLLMEARLATREESSMYVDMALVKKMTGKKVMHKKAMEDGYELKYLTSKKLRQAYEDLPKQAKAVLDLMNRTESTHFTSASIEVLLNDNKAELKTKQDPMKIFTFYKKRFIAEGHIVELDEENIDEEVEEDEDEE